LIKQTTALLAQMEHNLRLDARLSSTLRSEIRQYNRKILAYSSDQIIPIERPFGGRWFDDFTVSQELIEHSLTGFSPAPSS
jgi:clorobiocin biosynthesis protein CloN6